MTIDGNGVALVIGAIAGGIVTVGTFIMQIVTFLDNRKRGNQRGRQIEEVKNLVNGKTEKEMAAAAQAGYEQGREHQRIAPDTPSPRVAVIPSAAIATVVVPPTGDKP